MATFSVTYVTYAWRTLEDICIDFGSNLPLPTIAGGFSDSRLVWNDYLAKLSCSVRGFKILKPPTGLVSLQFLIVIIKRLISKILNSVVLKEQQWNIERKPTIANEIV